MKKCFALLLALTLVMGASLASATELEVSQATTEFDVTLEIPEGYEAVQDRENGNLYIDILPSDKAQPEYWLSIGYSEEYDGVTFNDLSEEDVDSIVAEISTAFAAPVWSEATTKEGTQVCVMDETEGESDWALIFTIYKGYFITVQIEKDDYSMLSEADIQRAVDLLGDMHFVDQP